jgi:hypothetical protein
VLGLDAPEVLVEVVLHGGRPPSPSTNQENCLRFPPPTNSGLYSTRTDGRGR